MFKNVIVYRIRTVVRHRENSRPAGLLSASSPGASGKGHWLDG
jgi:hypothetical protein